MFVPVLVPVRGMRRRSLFVCLFEFFVDSSVETNCLPVHSDSFVSFRCGSVAVTPYLLTVSYRFWQHRDRVCTVVINVSIVESLSAFVLAACTDTK